MEQGPTQGGQVWGQRSSPCPGSCQPGTAERKHRDNVSVSEETVTPSGRLRPHCRAHRVLVLPDDTSDSWDVHVGQEELQKGPKRTCVSHPIPARSKLCLRYVGRLCSPPGPAASGKPLDTDPALGLPTGELSLGDVSVASRSAVLGAEDGERQ